MNASFFTGLCAALLCLAAPWLNAQNIQDQQGNTLFSFWGGQFSFNTKEESLSMEFSRLSGAWEYGGNISGKATSGLASLFSGGKMQPGVAAEVQIGYTFDLIRYQAEAEKILREAMKKLTSTSATVSIDSTDSVELGKKLDSIIAQSTRTTKIEYSDSLWSGMKTRMIDSVKEFRSKEFAQQSAEQLASEVHEKLEAISNKTGLFKQIRWISLSLGYRADAYTLYNRALPTAKQLSSDTFKAGSIALAYNSMSREKGELWSLRLSVRRDHNLDRLDRKEIARTKTETDTSSTVSSKETIMAYEGLYTRFVVYDLQYGYYYKPFPDVPFALVGYAGVLLRRSQSRTYKFGFGLYINRDQEFLAPICGILVGYEDVLNSGETVSPSRFNDYINISVQVSLPVNLVL